MTPIRTLLRRFPGLAMLMVVAALCVKAWVPAGYMPDAGSTRILAVRLCSDMQGALQLTVPEKPGHGDAGRGDGGAHHPVDACPFGTLAAASLGAADPVLLAAALAFVLALGFAASVPTLPRRASRWRPPLRGPPLPT
jgi:hypothetical protein